MFPIKQINPPRNSGRDRHSSFSIGLLEQRIHKNSPKIARIRQFSSPELIQMLREALDAME